MFQFSALLASVEEKLSESRRKLHQASVENVKKRLKYECAVAGSGAGETDGGPDPNGRSKGKQLVRALRRETGSAAATWTGTGTGTMAQLDAHLVR